MHAAGDEADPTMSGESSRLRATARRPGGGAWRAFALLLALLVAPPAIGAGCTPSSDHGTGDDPLPGGSGGSGGTGGRGGSGGGTAGTDCAEEPLGTPAPFGLDARPPNPTCVAPPRPASAAAVELRRVFPALSFDQPLLLLQAPGDDARWYVVEKTGRVHTFAAAEDVASAEVFVDIRDRVEADYKESGLLGMAFHPDWPAVREVFLSYTTGRGGFHSVISRFQATSDVRLDPDSEEMVLEIPQPKTHHNGGNIVFGPDRMLYVGMGDGGQGINVKRDELLLGKMLRIDPIGARPYAIPPDNPWVDGPLRGEVWATGFRNPWRFSFDRETGELWLGDVGAASWEEIDKVERGLHYGWPTREGAHCLDGSTTCDTAGLTEPILEYGHDQGLSITGGYVYRGNALPALLGAYLFGDFVTGRVWALFPDERQPELLIESGIGLASFGQANDGEIYAVDHFAGGIYQLVGVESGGPAFPGRLSETGCFDPADPRNPVEALLPYDVNVPLWSDGAHKARWIAIPDGTKIEVAPDGDWIFPVGTVLAKNFSIGCRLVETRLFVRHEDGGWAGYTYEWNEEQTDAFLLSNGRTVQVGDQEWAIPSRAACMQCHTAAAGRALGPETAQLDREIVWPTGRRSNIIDTLVHIGVLAAEPDRSAGPLPPPDGDAHVEARAKSYLHSNCSSCHRPGGTGQGTADFRYATQLGEMGICDVEPQNGDLGVEGARLLVPGSPESSILALRMRSLASTRMPPVGTHVVDEMGTSVVEEWVRWLDACP